MLPSVDTNAAVWRSPISPWSAIVGVFAISRSHSLRMRPDNWSCGLVQLHAQLDRPHRRHPACVERGSDRQEDEAEYVQPGYTKQDQSDAIEQEAGSHGYCAQCTTGQHAADLLSWRQTLTSQTRDPGGDSDEVDQHQPEHSA